MIAGGVLNVILDSIFIYTLNMGIKNTIKTQEYQVKNNIDILNYTLHLKLL